MRRQRTGTLSNCTKKTPLRWLFAVAMAIAAMAGQPAGNAAEYIYNPVNGANDLWSDGTNWSAAPLSSELTQLTFVGNNATVLANGLTNTNVNTLAPFSLKALNLQGTGPSSGAATINISSAVSGGGYLNLTAPAGIYGYPVVNLNAMAGTAGLTYDVASNLNLATSAYFQGNGTATFNFSGAISGNGGIIKSGSSVLTLSGANTFTGDTQVAQGTLVLAHSNALQNSTLDYNGGGLSLGCLTAVTLGGLKGNENLNLDNVALASGYNNQSTTYGGSLSGSMAFGKFGDGVLTLTGSNTYRGETFLAWGTLVLGNTNALQNSTLIYYGGDLCFESITNANFGGLQYGTCATLSLTSTSNQPVTLSVGSNNQSTTYSGPITGLGSLIKTGTGTLTLERSPASSGPNTYAGPTTITSGTLALGSENALPANSDLILNGGTLATNGYSQTLGGLTVADDSYIDFGNGNSWLLLADSHLATWSGDLTILNWSGSESGLGTDKVKFGSSASSLTADQLRHIFFVDPYGLTGTFGATMLSTGEVVALPEPTTWSLAIAGVLFGIFLWRRQQSTRSA